MMEKQMEKRKPPVWSTQDEISYLENCGKWNYRNRLNPESRKKLLEIYREHMKERIDWGEINKFEIECYLEKES